MRQRRREERLKRIETEDETAELSVDAPGGVLEEGSKFVSGGGEEGVAISCYSNNEVYFKNL